MENIEKELTEVEKAQQIIEAEFKKTTELASEKIAEILKEFNLTLVPVGKFEGNKLETQIIFAKAS
jgi:hypothetical protein